MGFLALAVLCNILLGVTFKITSRRIDTMELLTVNYVAAGALAAGLLWSDHGMSAVAAMFSPGLAALSIATGVLFIGGFFLFAYATATAGMSLAFSAMRVSIAIPFAASWLIWGETPTEWHLLGMAMAGAAVLMITIEPGVRPRWDWTGVLFILFLSGGLVDVSLKAFNEWYGAVSDADTFMVVVFLMAFLIGLSVLLIRRRGLPDRKTVLWGLWLGVINYGSVYFLLEAVARMPGTVAFPANGVSVVVGGAVLGVVVFKERVTRLQAFGILLACGAVAFLTSP